MKTVVLKPPNIELKMRDIQQAIEKGLDLAAEQAKALLLKPTEGWSDKPNFIIEKSAGRRSVYTQHNYYVWVNNGTNRQGRRTVAKGRALHLPSKWEPKTRPNDLEPYGGARAYVSREGFYKSVPMSSIEPRKWDVLVADKFRGSVLILP